jgi:hypothetical protein
MRNTAHKLAAAIFLAIASSTVSAALVSVDWMNPGDKLITRDTSTALDWLKLTETSNRSYNDVSTQFGSGGDFEGMRYASSQEVIDLYLNNFLIDLSPGTSIDPIAGYDSNIATAAFWLGNIFKASDPDPTVYPFGVLGITAEDWNASGYLPVSPEDAHVRMGAYQYRDNDTLPPGNVSIYNPQGEYYQYDTNMQVFYGSYLVSNIPLPASVWLFGSGLLGLAGISRRKKTA